MLNNTIPHNQYTLNIKYGDFECDTWQWLNGVNTAIIQQYIAEIKRIDWGEHQLWFFGGILENRRTKDLDGAIIGPYIPDKIQYLLNNVVKVGFDIGVYPDVFYMKEGALFEDAEGFQTRTHIFYNGTLHLPKRKKQFALPNSDGLYERKEKYPLRRTVFLKKFKKIPPQRII